MATKTIPAHKETTCDACRKLCAPDGTTPREKVGEIKIIAYSICYTGEKCNDYKGFELCDRCLDIIRKQIMKTVKTLGGFDD